MPQGRPVPLLRTGEGGPPTASIFMVITCYVDEAGCPGKLPSASSPVQPFLILAAVALRSADINTFTRQVNRLKRAYLAAIRPGTISTGQEEIKGSELRALLRKDPSGHTPAHRFLDEMLGLLQRFDAQVFAQVAPKPVGAPFDGKAVYASMLFRLARSFHGLLEQRCAEGFMVGDFREPRLNSLMTQAVARSKFGDRDALPRLLDVPVFGHSESHAGLQVADWLASALIFPIVSHRHAGDLEQSAHLHLQDGRLARRYRKRLHALLGPVPPELGACGSDGGDAAPGYGLDVLLK